MISSTEQLLISTLESTSFICFKEYPSTCNAVIASCSFELVNFDVPDFEEVEIKSSLVILSFNSKIP